MTISTSNSISVGIGNGATVLFAYNFLIPAAADTLVVYTDPNGIKTTIAPSLYTILGIGNPTGGTVRYPLSGTPIPVGSTLTIQRVLPFVQTTTVSNQGAFYPNVIENALDYLMMCIQQVSAGSGGVTPPVSSALTIKQLKQQLANIGQIYVVTNSIGADLASTANIEWNSGGNVALGDPLSNVIQIALGYTNAQMQALFTAAASNPQ